MIKYNRHQHIYNLTKLRTTFYQIGLKLFSSNCVKLFYQIALKLFIKFRRETLKKVEEKFSQTNLIILLKRKTFFFEKIKTFCQRGNFFVEKVKTFCRRGNFVLKKLKLFVGEGIFLKKLKLFVGEGIFLK